MNWIITDSNNLLIILCGIFYSILCVFSIVDDKRDAYVFMRDCELTYDNFSNISLFQKAGKNISSVTSYDSGIAMMYENGDVALYGSDFDESPDNIEFTGEIVFSDVKAAFGGYKNLVLPISSLPL